jgi:hypothetical protein
MNDIKEFHQSLSTFDFDFSQYETDSTIVFHETTRSEETKRAISESKMGTKQTPEHIQKRVEKMIGFKQSDYQKQRVAETLATAWVVTTPEGKTMNIVNLRDFCRKNNLDQGNMSRGKHKGWKCVKIAS